jgi:hypothetical protein
MSVTQKTLLFYCESSKNSQPCASPQRSESCPLLSSLEDDLSSCEWVKWTVQKVENLEFYYCLCVKKW